MLIIPVDINSVRVPWVKNGCCDGGYDTTYPIRLNGIISPDEYRESIEKINRITGGYKELILLLILFFSVVILGIILVVTPGTRSSGSDSFFSAQRGFGMAFIFIGFVVVFPVGFPILVSRDRSKTRQAVNEESVKYSTRSSTPCSWRFETGRYYGNNVYIPNCIVIEIGLPSASSSDSHNSAQGVNTSSQVQEQHASPPSYSSVSNGYCSRCNAIRTDNSAQFCSSCGQAFNKQ